MTAGGRALTLIELLIVLAIALAIGAVSFGGAMSWSDAERLASVQDGLSSAALETRSKALAQQRPVELVAERDGRGRMRVGVLTSEETPTESGDAFGEPMQAFPEERFGVLYELPGDMDIATDEVSEFPDASGERIVLLRVLPDGSVSMLPGAWTLTQGDAVFKPTIETWTARLSFTFEETDENAGVSVDEPVRNDGDDSQGAGNP